MSSWAEYGEDQPNHHWQEVPDPWSSEHRQQDLMFENHQFVLESLGMLGLSWSEYQLYSRQEGFVMIVGLAHQYQVSFYEAQYKYLTEGVGDEPDEVESVGVWWLLERGLRLD